MSTFYGLIFVFDFVILIESQMFDVFIVDADVDAVVVIIILLFISVTINRRILYHRPNEESTTNYRIKYQFYAARC